MKIERKQLSLDVKLAEFDVWVTPSIVEIKSTKRFRDEMEKILVALEIFSAGAPPCHNDFPFQLADRLFSHLDDIPISGLSSTRKAFSQLDQDLIREVLDAASSLLFLVTGKSDNNHKCQLPIYLRNELGWDSLPRCRILNGHPILENEGIPRTLDSKNLLTRASSLYLVARAAALANATIATEIRRASFSLVYNFIASLLVEQECRAQLSEFINHYLRCRENNSDPTLILTPLALFQVRGSVAATGGHEPEDILRQRMTEWGLRANLDFNTADVVVNSKLQAARSVPDDSAIADASVPAKTRAYDFVIPFKTDNWYPRIFIQSQFYAGDSGSVSHKNVDQTKATRIATSKFIETQWRESPAPLFVEYLDGAGYCASLNGDLKRLLSFTDTYDFFQVRSAPVRLRRLIQEIGFLTPLEVCHAAIVSAGNPVEAAKILRSEQYTDAEIQRGLVHSVEIGAIDSSGGNLKVQEPFLDTSLKYYILDHIAKYGRSYNSAIECRGNVLIPGFGPYFGIGLGDLAAQVPAAMPGVEALEISRMIQSMSESGEVILR